MKKIEQGKSNRAENQVVRLFFALWPGATLQNSFHVVATSQQKNREVRGMRAETLHLTLLFLGDVLKERLPELFAAASGVQVGAFELELDRIALWKHNGIVYLAPSRPPGPLFMLVEQLGMHIEKAGFTYDRKDFVPHITLLRKARSTDLARQSIPLNWKVQGFSLMQSVMDVHGARYECLGCWPLR